MAFTIAEGVINVSANTNRAFAAIGALGGSMNAVSAIASTMGTAVAGGLALLPAAAATGAVAMGVLTMATTGFSDALTGSAAAQQEAFAAMGPQAQSVVTTLRGLGSGWNELRRTVQDSVVTGMGGDIQQLANTYMPMLTTMLPQVGAQFNIMGRSALQALNMPENQNSIRTVLAGTTTMLSGMGPALGNVVTGFLTLAGAGTTSMSGLGTAISGVTAKFSAWATEFVNSGRFDVVIANAKIAMTQLGALIGSVGSSIGAIFTAAQTAGVGLMPIVLQVTTAISNFLNSAQGQTALVSLFTILNTVAGQLGVAIGFLAPIFASIVTAIAPMAGMILPIVAALAGMAAAVRIVQAAMAAYRGVMLLAQAATAIATGAQWLWNAALAANPIGIVVVAIGALVAALVVAYNSSETFRNIVNSAWAGVKSGITSAVNGIKGVVAWFGTLPGLLSGWFNSARAAVTSVMSGIQSNINGAVNTIRGILNWFGQLPGLIGGHFRNAASAAQTAIGTMIGFVQAVPGRIRAGLGNLGSLLLSAGRDVINGLANGIRNGIGNLLGTVRDLAGSVLNAAKSALGIASPSKVFRDEVGKQVVDGVVVGMNAMLPDAVRRAGEMGNMIASAAAAGADNGLASAAQEALSHLTSGGRLYEDLAFKGMSANLAHHNDGLAEAFYASGGRNLRGFLAGVANSPPRTRALGNRAASAQTGSVTNIFNVTIDGQTVATMRDVSQFFDRVQQTARRGGTSVSGMRV